MQKILVNQFIKELESEVIATRKCLERMKAELYDWKPHQKSMQMGYLALVIAEIPLWIKAIIEEGVIDFGTWKHVEIKTGEEFAKHFDENVEAAKKALQNISDEDLEADFILQNKGVQLSKDSKLNTVYSSINHLIHHRGQLTVYLRLNNIPVPSLYGPSADDKSF